MYGHCGKLKELPTELKLFTDDNWTFDAFLKMYLPTPEFIKSYLHIDLSEKYGDAKSKVVIKEIVRKVYNYIYMHVPYTIDPRNMLEIEHAYDLNKSNAIKMAIISLIEADNTTGIASVGDEIMIDFETMTTAEFKSEMEMPADVKNILVSSKVIYKRPRFIRYSEEDVMRAWTEV